MVVDYFLIRAIGVNGVARRALTRLKDTPNIVDVWHKVAS